MKRVPAPQDALVLAVDPRARVGDADVRGQWHEVVVDGIRLAGATKRRSTQAATAHHVLLLRQHALIPRADDHQHAAVHLVRAAGQPGGSIRRVHPHVAGHARRIVGVKVGGTVLEAEQIAARSISRVGWRLIEARLRPAHRCASGSHARERAQRVLRDQPCLGAALHRQITVGTRWVDCIAGEGREVDERGRSLVGEAEARIKQGRAEADRDRQPIGTLAERLARIRRRLVGFAGIGQRQAAGQQADRALPGLEQLDELLARRARHEIKGSELQVFRCTGRDAGLMDAERIDTAVGIARGVGSRVGLVDQTCGLCEQHCCAAGDGGGDQTAASDVRDVHGRLQVD